MDDGVVITLLHSALSDIFLSFRILAIKWKNLVFLSPNLHQVCLDFCLHIASTHLLTIHRLEFSRPNSSTSESTRCRRSPSASNLCILLSISASFLSWFLKTLLFHFWNLAASKFSLQNNLNCQVWAKQHSPPIAILRSHKLITLT